jgi:hypothetical protein
VKLEPSDRARVRELLGREPQGYYEIVVRDVDGDPIVLKNAPFLDDGRPMPTRYWLIGPNEIRRVGQLEAAGGVDAAEADIDPTELAAAHSRYEAERDAAIPADHSGPRPSGGVGGTRLGVKCLHAHWAWHLSGGDDPVGRWIADRLDPPVHGGAVVDVDRTHVRHGSTTDFAVPWGSDNLAERWLADTDPPRPEALTNALGTITDHLDDLVRLDPGLLDLETFEFAGPTIESLAGVELGKPAPPGSLVLGRESAEEIFRMVATETSHDRMFNPGLPSTHVDSIVATCSIVLAFMRRLRLDQITLQVAQPD